MLLAACGGQPAEHRAEYAVFGTVVEMQLRGAEETTANSIFAELGETLQRMHHELHPWQEGELAEINRALASSVDAPVGEDIEALIAASKELETASRGTFNPAIGALVSLWGFHTSDYPITRPPPEDADIDALLAERPSMRQVAVLEGVARSTNPLVRLDFSGIAKGLAARRACQLAERHAVPSAMINLGGDVMVCAVDDKPWRVAIRDPAGGVLETIEVDRPLAVFTSGNYYRYGDFNGQRHAHVLDPNTGHPVGEVMQATAMDPDPLTADAAATALVVVGPEHWREIAHSMQIEQAIIVDAAGQVERYFLQGTAGPDGN